MPNPPQSHLRHYLPAVALACGLAAGAAHAQSSVQLYGLLDASVGQFQNAGESKVKRLDSGDMSTSYFGVGGREDLGGGLAATFALESFLLLDSGAAGRVPGVDSFWARNANVGLSSREFGWLKLGRQGPPLFVSTLLFNAFGDSFGFSPAIRQWYNAPYGTPLVGDSGWSNAVGYSTPKFGGLSANALVAAGEGAKGAKGPNYGLNLLYFGDALSFTLAAQRVEAEGVLGPKIATFPGFSKQWAYQGGISYKFGPVKLYGQYGEIKTKATADVDTKNYNVGFSADVGPGSLLGQYGRSKIDMEGSSFDPKSEMLTVGYMYPLSKRTSLYGVYMLDKFSGLDDGNTFALGVKHLF
jgi:predicted porin